MQKRGKKKKKTLLVVKFVPSTREEKTVQYLFALTEKQQWQQSLQLIFNPREDENKLNRFPFLKK